METVTAFWVRSDVFQHGLLPLKPDSGLSWSSLKQLVHKYQVARNMSREYFRVVEATFNFTEWKTVASEDLRLSETQIEIGTDVSDIHERRDGGGQLATGWALFYEFVMFLAVQLIGVRCVKKEQFMKDGEDQSKNEGFRNLVVDHAETQINFISDNLLTLISLISSAPILEGNTRIQNAQETAEEGELIDPEQLSYLSFLIGGSQTLERFDLEAENWFAILPVSKIRGKYKVAEVVDTLRANLTVNHHLYHIASFRKAPINPVIPTLVKTRPRGRSRGASLSSTYTAVTRSLQRPLIIKQITGEVVVKVDANFVPSMITSVEPDDEEFYATINGVYTPDPISSHSPTTKKRAGTISGSPTAAMTTTMTSTIMTSTLTTTTTTTANLDDSEGSFGKLMASKISSELDSEEELEYSGQDSLESDTQGECSEILVSDTHIVDANESSIYLLFPTGNVYIKASNRSTIVLGAVAGNLTLEGCENCTIVAATHCMQIISCRKLQLNLLVNTPPILLGDNSHLTFGPYNTHYACLEPHLALASIDVNNNFYEKPLLYSQHMILFKPILLEEYKRAGLGGIGGVGNLDACLKDSSSEQRTSANPKKTEVRKKAKSISWRDKRNSLSGFDIGSGKQSDGEPLKDRTVAKGATGVSELYQLYGMDGEDFRFDTTSNDFLAPINKQEEKKREILQEKSAKLATLHEEFSHKRIYNIQSPKTFMPFSIPVFLQGPTKKNPVPLSAPFQAALTRKVEKFTSMTEQLDYLNETQKAKVKEVLASAFKDWLKSTGNTSELDRLVKAHLYSIRRAHSQRK